MNIKRVALELGGKSPNIVFADADFETAVDNALTAAFTHSGQVCSAGCRAIVEDDDLRPVRRRRSGAAPTGSGWATATTTRRRPARSSPPSTAPRSRATSRARIDEGARLVAGGRRPDEPDLQDGFFYRPTVFADVRRDMRIVREEVFGPVLTVERFTTEDEAIELGNDTTYGLAGAVWTADASRAQRVAGATAPWHGLDQRLQHVPSAGRMGRVQAVRHRPGTWPDGP